jgi:sulfate permease, SulP family
MSSAVMLATVAVTVATSNLALGVTVGVLLSGVFFTFKVAGLLRVTVDAPGNDGRTTYSVSGQVFFASADMFVDAFDVGQSAGKAVTIDVSKAHFWDITAVAALDKVTARFKAQGATVDVLGMNQASATLIETLDRPSASAAS